MSCIPDYNMFPYIVLQVYIYYAFVTIGNIYLVFRGHNGGICVLSVVANSRYQGRYVSYVT